MTRDVGPDARLRYTHGLIYVRVKPGVVTLKISTFFFLKSVKRNAGTYGDEKQPRWTLFPDGTKQTAFIIKCVCVCVNVQKKKQHNNVILRNTIMATWNAATVGSSKHGHRT